MLNHNGSIGVVILEEFEKLGDAAKEALLHPLESGEWSVKKPGKTICVDCSNIIFLMTSNLKNKEILGWLKEKKAIEKWSASKSEKETKSIELWIIKEVSQIIKNSIKDGRVKEFARRLEVIPFVSFNSIQQQVIVEAMEEKLSSRYKHPPEGERLYGNLDLIFMPEFNKDILKQYDEYEGATSLVTAIHKRLNDAAIEIEKLNPKPTSMWFYINPEYKTQEFSFTKPEEKKNVELPKDKMDINDNAEIPEWEEPAVNANYDAPENDY